MIIPLQRDTSVQQIRTETQQDGSVKLFCSLASTNHYGGWCSTEVEMAHITDTEAALLAEALAPLGTRWTLKEAAAAQRVA